MKISRIVTATLIVLASIMCFSCSQITQPSDEEVIEKINSGEELASADYETIMDYLEEFCEEMETGETYEDGQEIGRAYPYFLQFAMVYDRAPEDIKEQARYTEIKDRFKRVMYQ